MFYHWANIEGIGTVADMNYEQVIIDVLSEASIEYWTEGKNVSADTVNVNCPFCPSSAMGPDPSNHCGIFKETMKFNCWRCNKKGSFAFLVAILTHTKLEYCERMIQDMGVTGIHFCMVVIALFLTHAEMNSNSHPTRVILMVPDRIVPKSCIHWIRSLIVTTHWGIPITTLV